MSHELFTGLGIAGIAIGIGITVVALTTPPRQAPAAPGQPSNPLSQAESLFSQAMGAMNNTGSGSGTGSGGSPPTQQNSDILNAALELAA